MHDTIHDRVQLSSLSAEELVRVCVETGGAAAWEEFVRRFQPVIAGTVVRTARRFRNSSFALADDLIQDCFLRLFANDYRILRQFIPRGPDSIFGWLRAVAHSVTHDHFRGRLAGIRGGGAAEVPLESGAERAAGDSSSGVERQILLREIDEHLQSVCTGETGARDCRIFWLRYRHGMTTRAIASIPAIGLSQKGVESVVYRLTEEVRAWLSRLGTERSGSQGAK